MSTCTAERVEAGPDAHAPVRSVGPVGGPGRSRRAPRRPHVRWRLLAAGGALAGAAAVAVGTGTLTGAWSVLLHLRWWWVPLVVAAEVASKAAVAGVHRRLLRAGGTRLPLRWLLALTYAGNAVAVTVPLVGAELAVAFAFRQLRSRGVTASAAGWTFLVSGVLSTTAYAGLLAVAVALTGSRSGVLLGAGVALAGALPGWAVVVVLHRPAARRRLLAFGDGLLRRLARHRHAGNPQRPAQPQARLAAAVDQFGALRLPVSGWVGVSALAVANWVLDGLCLAAAVSAVGAAVPWFGLPLAFLAAAGVSTLAVTPGGLGTVELALTAALAAAGLDAPHALAAALLYRLATLWLAGGAGWLLYTRLSPEAVPSALIRRSYSVTRRV